MQKLKNGTGFADTFMKWQSVLFCKWTIKTRYGIFILQMINIDNMLQNKKVLWQLSFELVFSVVIIVIAILVDGYSTVLLASVVGAILPDVIDNSPFWSPVLRKTFPTNYYHKFHEYFHFTITTRKYFYLGYLTQFIIIAISLYIVVK